MTSRDPKGQGRDPDIFEAQFLDNRERYMVDLSWPMTSRDPKGQGRDPNTFEA